MAPGPGGTGPGRDRGRAGARTETVAYAEGTIGAGVAKRLTRRARLCHSLHVAAPAAGRARRLRAPEGVLVRQVRGVGAVGPCVRRIGAAMPPPASTDRPAPQLWQDGRAAGGAPSVLRPRRPVTDPGSGTAPRTATAPRPGAEPRSGMDRGELDSLLGALRERRSSGALPPHVGSAEWDLLTDGARCSAEFAAILGRDPALPAPGLDELPSYVHPEDRAALTTLMTGCLVDGRKLDGTLRLLRADGSERTVRLLGEPVLDAEGCAASLWLVVRETAPGTARRAAPAAPPAAREEYRVAVALRDSVLPP
ncbi:conserved hypothetical protein, partial [Streptomyces sp. SPB78]